MAVNNCDNLQEVKFSCASMAENRVEADRFVVFESVTVEVIRFNYDGYANAAGSNWMRLELKGVATLMAGNKVVNLALAKEFEKPLEQDSVRTSADFDTDVYLDLAPSESGQFNVAEVLSIVQKTVEDLYPLELHIDRASINFEGLSFSYPEGTMHIELGERGIFSLHLLGREKQISGSPLLNSAKVAYLVCQNGEDSLNSREVFCGFAAKFLYKTFNFRNVLGVTKGDIMAIEAFQGLSQVKNILFLSSRRGIAYSAWTNLEDLGTIMNVNDRSSFGEEMLVPPGLSVKFRMNPSAGLKLNMPGVVKKFVFAWPDTNGVTLRIPGLGALSNAALQHFLPAPDGFSIGDVRLAENIQQKATISEISIKVSQEQDKKYCLKIIPAPELTVISACVVPTGSTDEKCAVTLRNTTITKCYDPTTQTWDLSGSGAEANVIGSISNITVAYEDQEAVVKGNLMTSNMAELNLELAKYGGYNVPEKGIVPDAIANFTITDLNYKAPLTPNGRIQLSGKAKVCANTDAELESVFYRNSERSWKHGTCITFSNADLARITNLLFDKVMLSQSWLNFDSLSLVIRDDNKPATEMGGFASPTCLLAEERSRPEHVIRVAARQLNMTSCEGPRSQSSPGEQGKTSSKPCLFLRRTLGDSQLGVTYHGFVTSRTFYAETRVNARLNLGGPNNIWLEGVSGAGVFAEAERSNLVGYIAANTDGKEGGDASFRGTLVFGSTNNRVHAEVRFRGDSIQIMAYPEHGPVSRMKKDYNPDLMMIPNVRMRNNRIKPYDIDHDQDLEYIMFSSGVTIGSAVDITRRINVSGEDDETKQYIYGVDGETRNKFVACAQEDRGFTVDRLLAAFDIPDAEYLPLEEIWLIQACFAYQNSDQVWNISRKGILAQKGLYLYGKVETDGNVTRPMRMHFRGSGDVVVEVELPPVAWATSKARLCPVPNDLPKLKPCVSTDSNSINTPDACLKEGCCWSDEIAEAGGPACHQFSDTVLNVSRLEMFGSKESPGVGPLLTVRYAAGKFASGQIEGYTNGIGFSEKKTMYISRSAEGVCQYDLEHIGSVYGQLNGKVTFSATHCSDNITNAKFRMSIDVHEDLRRLVRETSAQQFLKRANETRHRFVEQVLNPSREIESWKARLSTELQEGDAAVAVMERELKEYNQRLQTSANSMRRSCVDHCRPVHMPNWKWSDACMRSSDGRSAGCLKYDRNAQIVSNVGCLTTCEAGRVRALGDVEEGIASSQRILPELVAKLQCREIGQHLRASVERVNSESEEIRNSTLTKMEFLTDLETKARENPDNFIDVGVFSISCDLENVVEPKCFNVTIEVSAVSAQGGYTALPRRVVMFCFNGKLAKTVIHFAYKSLYAQSGILNDQINDAEKRFAFLDQKRRVEIADMHSAYKKCINEKRQLKAEVDRGRAAAAAAESVVEPSKRALTQAATDAARFSTLTDRTLLSFNFYSPWATLHREDDPFLESEKRIYRRNDASAVHSITQTTSHPCNVTRRSLAELQDISEYMKAWSQAHEHGRQSLDEVKRNIHAGLHAVRSTIEGYARERSQDHFATKEITRWMNETDRGMASWFTKSVQRLAEHDEKGMSLMKRFLEASYADNNHGNFASYLESVSKVATNAYKRSFKGSNVHDHESFGEIVKSIRSVLAIQKLSEASGLINSLSDFVTRLDKRTLTCLM